VSTVIWQKATSPFCHPSQLWTDSSNLDPLYGSLESHASDPKQQLDQFSHF